MHGVIFDLDGTLADTLGDITASINHALAAHGLPAHEPAVIRGFVGDGLRPLAERAAGSTDPALIEPVMAAFREHYREHLLDTTRPYPGVRELLADLKQRGVRLSVLSNKPHEPTCQIVADLFPDASFAAVQGQLPGVPKKPDPQQALAIAAAMKAAPDRCLFVGDSAADLQTGLAAGMIPVGVSWGFRDPAQLLAAGATKIIHTPAELLDLIR